MQNPFRKRSKIIMKGELSNVDVKLVSLLFDDYQPANGKSAVIKGSDGHSYKQFSTVPKFKAADQGRIYVTLMEPDVKDKQGDHYSKEEIQKACDSFSQGGLVNRNDVNHNFITAPEFYVAESYILKAEDKENFPDTAVGSWVQVLKCKDLESDLWKKVKKGQFKGVSIYGRAEDDENVSKTELLDELRKGLSEIKKAIGTDPSEDGKKAIDVLEKQIKELEIASDKSEITELIKGLTKAFEDMGVTLAKTISKSIKDDEKVEDQKLSMGGVEVLVKSAHKEIYKGIAQVDSGAPMNILNSTTTSLFIDEVVGGKEDDTLTEITVVPLIKDERIDVGLVQDLVFKNSLDGSVSAEDIAQADIPCATGILLAEYTLSKDTVEFYKDKYGDAAFGAYVEQHIAKKAGKAIRKLLFRGDRDSATAALKGLDGVIKLATDDDKITEIDAETNVTYAEKFEAALLAFSEDMLEEQANFRFYISHHDLIQLRAELAKRETVAGDRFLLEGGNVSFAGIPVKGRLMPDGYIVAGLPQFIIIGYRTDAELKVEHHGSDWKYHWYIRIRPGITYVDGFVKVFQVV